MRWKKNGIGYAMWAIYTLAVSVVFGSLLVETAQLLGIQNEAVAVAAAAVVGLFLFLMFSGMRRPISRGSIRGNGMHTDEKLLKWSEPVVLIVLLGIGLVLRILCSAYAGEEGDYFQAARMIEGQAIPQVPHGAVYLYLQVLHGLFWLVGNKWMAGIWLQVILQLTACVLLYLAVRKLAGRAPATVMTAFLMLAPGKIAEGLTYSPKQLYLCIYAVALLLIAFFLQKRAKGAIGKGYNWILIFLTGAVTGLVCFLDVSGITLLPMVISVLWLRKSTAKNIWGNVFGELGVYLAGVIGSFAAYIAISAVTSGKGIAGAWSAWCGLYYSKAQNLSFWKPGEGENSTYLILFGLLFVGIFSFWCRKLSEKISPWMLMLIMICIMEYFQIPAEAMGSSSLLFLVCTILAGNGIADCFYHDTHRSSKERKEDDEEEKFVIWEEQEKQPESQESVAEANVEEAEEVQEVQEVQEVEAEEMAEANVEEAEINMEVTEIPKVELIENPLPLPKKHVKKVMDYAYQPQQEELEYDVEVADDDDFDI